MQALYGTLLCIGCGWMWLITGDARWGMGIGLGVGGLAWVGILWYRRRAERARRAAIMEMEKQFARDRFRSPVSRPDRP